MAEWTLTIQKREKEKTVKIGDIRKNNDALGRE